MAKPTAMIATDISGLDANQAMAMTMEPSIKVNTAAAIPVAPPTSDPMNGMTFAKVAKSDIIIENAANIKTRPTTLNIQVNTLLDSSSSLKICSAETIPFRININDLSLIV